MYARMLVSGFGIASQVLGNVVFFIILASAWPPDTFGRFSFWYAVSTVAALSVDYGYCARVLREVPIARGFTRRNLNRGLAFKVFMSATVLTSSIVAAAFVELPPFFWLLLSAMILRSVGEYFGCHLRAIGQHAIDTIGLFASNLFMVLLLVAVQTLRAELSPEMASLVLFGAKVLYAVVTFRAIVPRWKVDFRILTLSWKTVRYEARVGSPYAGDALVARAYGTLDVVVLNILAGPAAVGLYQSGQRLLQGFLPVAGVFTNVFLPVLTNPASRHYRASLAVLWVASVSAGLICAGFFFWVAPSVVPLVFSPAYSAIVPELASFGIIGLLRFVSAPSAVVLTALGYQKVRTIVNIVSLATMLIAAFVFVRSEGMPGLLDAVLLSNALLAVLYFGFMSFALGKRDVFRQQGS